MCPRAKLPITDPSKVSGFTLHHESPITFYTSYYRSGMVNSNTVNSKFHLIRIFYEVSVNIFLSFHVENALLIRIST